MLVEDFSENELNVNIKEIVASPEKFLQNSFEYYIENIKTEEEKNVEIGSDTVRNFNPLYKNCFKFNSEVEGEKIKKDEKLNSFLQSQEIPFLDEVIENINNTNSHNISNEPSSSTTNKQNKQKPMISLVKLFFSISNINENNIYLSILPKKENSNTKNLCLKFKEINEEDINNHEFNQENLEKDYLLERLSLEINPISTSIRKENKCPNSPNMEFIFYDYENNSAKYNTLLRSISIAYIETTTKNEGESGNENENSCIVVRLHSLYSEEITLNELYFKKDFSGNAVRKLFSNQSKEKIKEEFTTLKLSFHQALKGLFTNYSTNNNEEEDSYLNLISEYLILNLISSVFSRQGMNLIGYLPLNLSNLESNSKVKLNLLGLLNKVFPVVNYFNCTIESLESSNIIPTFNVDTEVLSKSILQCPKGGLIIIDETELKTGKLKENGIKNFNYIKKMIEQQVINLEYPYNPGIEIFVNNPILILSHSKSIFLQNSDVLVNIKVGKESNEKKELTGILNKESKKIENKDLESCIEYIRLGRILTTHPDFTENFIISEEI